MTFFYYAIIFDFFEMVFLISFVLFFSIFFCARNYIQILIYIEFLLLVVNLNFIFFSVLMDDAIGQIFSLFILTVAASESAIALAILVLYYRLHGNIFIYNYKS